MTQYIIAKFYAFVNMFFCNVHDASLDDQIRNFGIFREPGVWGIYMLLGMVLDMFYNKKEKGKTVWLIIWNIGAVSTFSPIVFLLALIIDCAYVLNLNIGLKNRLFAMMSIVLGGVVISQIPFLLTKITASFDKFSGGGSFMSRMGSMIGSINAWLESPLIGWGYTGMISGAGSDYLRQYTNDYTNTIVLNFAIFGVVFGTIYIFGLVNFLRKIRIPVGAILCILVLLCTQEMIKSALLFVIILYGICNGKYWFTESGGKQLR